MRYFPEFCNNKKQDSGGKVLTIQCLLSISVRSRTNYKAQIVALVHKTKHCVLIWKKPKYQWYINTIINQTCLSLWESAKLWWPKFVHICSVCFYIVKTRFLKSLSLCENSDDKIQQPSSQAWICYFCRYDGVIIINNITNVFITRLFQRIQSADYFYCKGGRVGDFEIMGPNP